MNEFCSLKGLDEEHIVARWLEVEKRVLLYAAKEGKKGVKSLLRRYNDRETEDAGEHSCTICIPSRYGMNYLYNLDRTTAYVLMIITAMLQPRGKAKASSVFSVFEVRFLSAHT